MATFDASKPSVRQALMILEVEGLVKVRRGRSGGALVCSPQIDNAARTIELILQSRSVTVDDVGRALQNLEPICAGMCAKRVDRETNVLPRLRQVNTEAEHEIEDPVAFGYIARRFHEVLVSCAGSETITVALGAIEAIWSAHTRRLAVNSFGHRETLGFDLDVRQRLLLDHEYLVHLIERGDEEGAIREARYHLQSMPTDDATTLA